MVGGEKRFSMRYEENGLPLPTMTKTAQVLFPHLGQDHQKKLLTKNELIRERDLFMSAVKSNSDSNLSDEINFKEEVVQSDGKDVYTEGPTREHSSGDKSPTYQPRRG